MTIDYSKLADAGRSVRALFLKSLVANPGPWQQFVMTVPQEGQENYYPWLGGAPRIEEWKAGERPLGTLAAYGFRAAARKWANGLTIKREHIEDDVLGSYAPVISQMAADFDLQKSEFLFGTLLAAAFGATEGTAYDGQYFIDTDHKDFQEAAQSNKGTAVLSATALEAAIAGFPTLTDDRGRRLSIMPTHLVVPPQLRSTALRIVGRQVVDENGAGVSNINEGIVQVMVRPELSPHPTYWFLGDLSKPLKPFIFQPRTPVEFVSLVDPKDPDVFKKDEYNYGGRERWTIVYGAWQLIWGSTGGA